MDEGPDYLRLAMHKVRGSGRDRVCSCCREIMPAGTPHWVHVFLEDGVLKTEHLHGTLDAWPICPSDIAEAEEVRRVSL
jgi:hypothetical protein